MSRRFLTAEWRHLVILNYELEPSVLAPFVPRGTELDSFEGRTYVSIVGFLFLDTRVLGLPIPFHRHFEEVNLRFYVRRKAEEGWRRGVVFVRELVPRAAIAAVARWAYGERYLALPMAHKLSFGAAGSAFEGEVTSATYSWTHADRRGRMDFVAKSRCEEIAEGSLEEFITEHYWGYAQRKDGGTTEYRVAHPRWRVATASAARFEAGVAELYGDAFVSVLAGSPASAFLADGSAVEVFSGARLRER